MLLPLKIKVPPVPLSVMLLAVPKLSVPLPRTEQLEEYNDTGVLMTSLPLVTVMVAAPLPISPPNSNPLPPLPLSV